MKTCKKMYQSVTEFPNFPYLGTCSKPATVIVGEGIDETELCSIHADEYVQWKLGVRS